MMMMMMKNGLLNSMHQYDFFNNLQGRHKGFGRCRCFVVLTKRICSLRISYEREHR